ncbi:repulsive guidance molecule B-like [Paramacrobiotus metropolitanus]|uniref:repulsive guidance molecule B-like n=1 Tax=Paramacrobiotus metropolitanus TaxID=2943436 RepID=UPI002445F3A7|nr:repulsive guidance molecule B-like [Paramacrobiotus metropolitanus]
MPGVPRGNLQTTAATGRYPCCNLARALALVYVVTAVLFVAQVTALCSWEECRELEENGPIDEADLWLDNAAVALELCQALDSHANCLKGSARKCRGNLHYYSYVKGLSRVMERKNCSALLAADADSPLSPSNQERAVGLRAETTTPPIAIPAFHGCHTMNLLDNVAYCALFGDPHLVTNEGRFQTCRIYGAYPLIENRHLAIQVSSQPVGRSSSLSPVTSISRITIIIKASECSEERKTYEASVASLPSFFTDATSDSDSSKILPHVPDHHVELRVLHLKTIIFIRRVGDYLSVAVRLPASLLTEESAVPYQLCSGGCPFGEELQRGRALGGQPLRAVQEAEEVCRMQNMSGPFLEACLFDMAVTGDVNSVISAKEAQADWERLAPVDSRTPGGGGGGSSAGWASDDAAVAGRALAALNDAGTLHATGWRLLLVLLFTKLFTRDRR